MRYLVLIIPVLFSSQIVEVFCDSCNGDRCGEVISMPLMDNLGATLKADLDVSTMNKHLKVYIQQEIQKGVESAMKKLLQEIIDRGLDDANKTILSTAERIFQGKGVNYIRWGRKDCPAGADLVYTGQVGGNLFSNKGGGVNFLCLPNNPENGGHQSYDNEQLFGAEYEFYLRTKPSGWSSNLDGGKYDVPCAVCHRKGRSSVLMIPGRKTCYDKWSSEFEGILVSDHKTYSSKDKDAQPLDNKATNENGALIYPIRTSCGSLRCPPYTDSADVLCVVCSN